MRYSQRPRGLGQAIRSAGQERGHRAASEVRLGYLLGLQLRAAWQKGSRHPAGRKLMCVSGVRFEPGRMEPERVKRELGLDRN